MGISSRFYIIDMFSKTGKEHCKFADDGTKLGLPGRQHPKQNMQ